MGQSADYRCPACGYHAEGRVSGYDVGECSHRHAVLCEDCRELLDLPLPGTPAEVAASLRRGRGGDALAGLRGEAWLARLGEAARARFPLRCPRSGDHRVRPWSHPGPCPRCGETLARGEHVVEWD